MSCPAYEPGIHALSPCRRRPNSRIAEQGSPVNKELRRRSANPMSPHYAFHVSDAELDAIRQRVGVAVSQPDPRDDPLILSGSHLTRTVARSPRPGLAGSCSTTSPSPSLLALAGRNTPWDTVQQPRNSRAPPPTCRLLGPHCQ